ncbi:MAG: SIS domain-containing protein [Ktedonobacteraceae bacterium]|nr:SIS domain-containing protein [Ktedonobacteraceae bacterium]
MYEDIQQYWNELNTTLRAMPLQLLAQAAEMLLDCHRRGNTVFLCGNGGSAATASHFACDLAKGTRAAGVPAFRVVALSDNVPLMTAWANDTSYERIFAEQLAALVRPEDLVVLISASGNSPNVLAAADVAHQAGATTIALTGQSGGRLAPLSDLALCVPAQAIEQVEDTHLIIAHSICVVIRQCLCARAALAAVEQSMFQQRCLESTTAFDFE